MAEIVNLRRVRKQRARADAEAKAQQNRIDFGRSKSERSATQTEHDRTARQLEGHRLETDDGDGPKR